MRFDPEPSQIAWIQSVVVQHPQLEKAILFGSREMGCARPGPDIDLALVGPAELNVRVLCRILNELDELWLPCTFDVSIYGAAKDPDVREHIRRAGVVLYQKAEPPASRQVSRFPGKTAG